MKFDIKVDREKSIKIIKDQIKKLKDLDNTNDVKSNFKDVIRTIDYLIDSNEVMDKLKSETMYEDNEYSDKKTKENISKAKERTIDYLEEILYCLNNDILENNNEFSQRTAILILKKILNNFYMHMEAMYENDVNEKAGITKEKLDQIKIVNEYDVQRILYSLIKPIFPETRLEVSNDTGFSTIRYDMLIEKYSIIIEVKCSRKSMSVKNLTEQIGSDIYHYKFKNIIFFIYDKEKIIKDVVSFTNKYNGTFNGKNTYTIVNQPKIL